MLKRLAFLILISLASDLAMAQDTAAIVARAQILKASPDQLLEAEKNTRSFVESYDKASTFFNRFIFVGPKLWARIKNIPEFSRIKQGNMTFKVPRFEADGSWKKTVGIEGKAIQSLEDYENLWKYLHENFAIDSATLVDKNLTDKFIYWLYFAKVEESCLAVSNAKGRFLIQFADNKIFFIELTSE